METLTGASCQIIVLKVGQSILLPQAGNSIILIWYIVKLCKFSITDVDGPANIHQQFFGMPRKFAYQQVSSKFLACEENKSSTAIFETSCWRIFSSKALLEVRKVTVIRQIAQRM